MTDIVRFASLTDRSAVEAEIERIFFAASGTQEFVSEEARHGFLQRWLGRYLRDDPQHVWVALNDQGVVIGYLAGSYDDPARTARFADIAYFVGFAGLTARYPAHLHVNVDEAARGAGIGGMLVEAFCRDAFAAGLPGVHVVTGKGARNVKFYEKLGFCEQQTAEYTGREIAFLGRARD